VAGIAKTIVHEIISENAHWGAHKQKNGCFTWKSLTFPRQRRIIRRKHHYGRWNMGLWVCPWVKKKFHDLEASSFAR
jgi:hypothetical protein